RDPPLLQHAGLFAVEAALEVVELERETVEALLDHPLAAVQVDGERRKYDDRLSVIRHARRLNAEHDQSTGDHPPDPAHRASPRLAPRPERRDAMIVSNGAHCGPRRLTRATRRPRPSAASP